MDNDPRLINALPEPWAALEGHSLAVVCCGVGKGGGMAGVEGRVWTGSMDGTVKVSHWFSSPNGMTVLLIRTLPTVSDLGTQPSSIVDDV